MRPPTSQVQTRQTAGRANVSRTRLVAAALRQRLGAGLVVALVALVGAGVLTLWPRGVTAMESAVVGARVAAASPLARDLMLRTSRWTTPDAEAPGLTGSMQRTLGPVVAALSGARDAIPEPARAAVGAPEARVSDATDHLARTDAGAGADVRFPELLPAAATGFIDRVRIIEGRAPADRGADARWNEDPTEVLVSRAGAERLGWAVGDVRDATVRSSGYRLVGTYEVLDPDDGYWLHTPAAVGPYVDDNLDKGVTVRVLGILDPQELLAYAQRPTLDVWYPVGAIGHADPTTVAAQLRAAAASASAPLGGVRFSTGMPALLDDAVADVATSRALGAFALAGPLAALALALGLGAQSRVAGRRDDLALARARGASGLQVRGLAALDTLLVSVPAAAVGTVIAAALGESVAPGEGRDLLGPALVALAPGALAAALVAPPRASVSRARLVRALRTTGGIALVGGAAGATVLALTGRLDAGDPLVVVLPALVAAATAVLVVALVRPGLGVLVRAARSTRGPGILVGLARAARGRPGVVAGILALVVGMGVVVQSTALLATVRGGADDSAWEATGADLRLSGPTMSPDLVARVEKVDGVNLAVAAEVLTPAALRLGGVRTNVDALVVDIARLARLDAAGHRHPDDAALSAVADPQPVVVSRAVRDALGEYAPGDVHLTAAGLDVPVADIASADVVAGLGNSSRWVLVDATALVAHGLERPTPQVLLVDVDDSLDAAQVTALGTTLAGIVGTGDVRSLAPERDAQLADPTIAWLVRGTTVGAGMALLAVAAALAAALAAAAPARRRSLAVLRSLGGGRRDLRTAVAVELAAWVVPGLVVGAGLGIGLTLVAVEVVDLPAFLDAREVPPRFDVGALALVTGVVVAAAAVAAVLTARARPTLTEEAL
ncbi:FtsX-like permease family protein [Sanguibacter sp. A247]|uniref:FtsX-like permease family protein n=1 Tax=unclassified Sanguibacter TaxID=2645534 RepID=UPI003FD7B390